MTQWILAAFFCRIGFSIIQRSGVVILSEALRQLSSWTGPPLITRRSGYLHSRCRASSKLWPLWEEGTETFNHAFIKKKKMYKIILPVERCIFIFVKRRDISLQNFQRALAVTPLYVIWKKRLSSREQRLSGGAFPKQLYHFGKILLRKMRHKDKSGQSLVRGRNSPRLLIGCEWHPYTHTVRCDAPLCVNLTFTIATGKSASMKKKKSI